jgi:hypothetical protein
VKAAVWVWIALVVLPLTEVALHFRARAAVPAESDWQRAAAFVRSELQPKDLIVSSPGWTDPLLRAALGERITPAMAGRSDLAGFERMWSLSIRGARPDDAATRNATLTKAFGGVTVERFELGRSSVRTDLVDRIGDAEASLGSKACSRMRTSNPRGGGLGYGVLPPAGRLQCDGANTWVAEVVLEDLDITPRRCVFQPPGVGAATRVVLHDVELSDQLVFYGGLYYEHERMRKGAPIVATLLANDKPIATFTHHDGDGWEKLAIKTQPGRVELAIEVRSTSRKQRGFCWAASVREGAAP